MDQKTQEIHISDYSYRLPDERIAVHPLPQRDGSKLLVYKSGRILDDVFRNLSDHLPPGSLLVLNDTKVIEARLHFQKESGGVIEIFCLEPYACSMEQALQEKASTRWTCLIGGASKWKPGHVLRKEVNVNGDRMTLTATYQAKTHDSFVIEFGWQPEGLPFAEVLHAAGAIPLPPYIKRPAGEMDSSRYQTVFGQHQGSVAAPTAALHFTPEVFASLRGKNISTEFVTLNVGAGTFRPVKTETIGEHHMHGEHFTVRKEALQNILAAETIVAVGTTCLRTLESLYWLGVKLQEGLLNENEEWELSQWEAYDLPDKMDYKTSLRAVADWMYAKEKEQLHCRTSLLIAPGYTFRIPSGLVTNFHQPGSTLLLLVAAFVGDDWKKIYQHALENGYRFLSYGDSSYLTRGPAPSGPAQS